MYRFLEVSLVRLQQRFLGHTGAAAEAQLEQKCWAVPTVLWAVPGLLNRIADDELHVVWKRWSSAHHHTLATGEPADSLDHDLDKGPEAPTGEGGVPYRWFVAVFAGCSVSSTICWFSRADPAARVAALRSNTVALPLLYFTFLLSARI